MEEDEKIADEMRYQLSFLFGLKNSMKDLDERIRTTSMFLARTDLIKRHGGIKEWIMIEHPDESTVKGMMGEKLKVIARVRTMSLHGKSSLGGRQHDSMKRNLEKVAAERAESKYFYLLDPWTVGVVKETFQPEGITILPLLKEDVASVIRSTPGTAERGVAPAEPMTRMVEEVVTREEFPEGRTIVSPISRTSIRQGFLYIPKDKGHLLSEGPVTIWIRKDASLVSKCMVSQTGGVRIGGSLTKWFRSIGLQPDDELVMGSQDDGSLLVLMIRRSRPFRVDQQVVETMKWQ